MRTGAATTRGFMLGELIITIVLSSLVIGAILAGMIALIRGLQPQGVTIGGRTLPIAPTFGAFPAAIRLHQSLTDHLSSARAVYVFGGRHLTIHRESAEAQVPPLKLQRLPDITDFSRGLPLHAKGFLDLYAAVVGAGDPTRSDEDFTLLAIGSSDGHLAPTCLVQVTRSDAVVSDGSSTNAYVVREVRLWDVNGAQQYAFAEKPVQAPGLFVGAVHTWMRHGNCAMCAEEGPTCITFPDPWIYAGSRGQADDVPAFSRFSYFVAVSP